MPRQRGRPLHRPRRRADLAGERRGAGETSAAPCARRWRSPSPTSLIRRTTLAFELRDNGRALAPAVAQLMAKELGWNAAKETAELVRYGREAGRMFRVE